MMILDVIAKPEEPLTAANADDRVTKYRDSEDRVYWRVVDSLGNEIWYSERAGR